jgi:hypothetical protein
MRDTPIKGGRALIVQHCCVYGDLPTPVRQFTVHPPKPYAQHPTEVLVSFIEPRRRNGAYYHVAPDNVRYLTIEQDGVIIYDSRSEVPCDMEQWKQSSLRHGLRDRYI